MTTRNAHIPGEKLNDPDARPADVADDRDHDDAGHTPKVPLAE